jgi:hypothetical protein
MDNGPWNIKDALLVVKQWPHELTNAEVILSTCSFWVQVHGLPLQNMTTVNAIKIEKFIGDDVLDVDNGDCPGIMTSPPSYARCLGCIQASGAWFSPSPS